MKFQPTFNRRDFNWVILFFVLVAGGCSHSAGPGDIKPQEPTFSLYLTDQVKYGLSIHCVNDSTFQYPRTLDNNSTYYAQNIYDWTVGFYPGVLWQAYDLTGNPAFRDAADKYSVGLQGLQNYTSTHDLGFMVHCSYGEGYELTQEASYRPVLINTANSLAGRFNSQVGLIKSWDWAGPGGNWTFPVIIDNMMNLELLFKATQLTGDSTYYDIAVTHALNTMQYHYRSDFSSFHVVDFNPVTGALRSQVTHQGYADNSDWARGQAWGLYGFTMCYRFTQADTFKDHAVQVADFLLAHPNMPADGIPYWDLKDPGIPNVPRDASAGAIMASAFLELYRYTGDSKYWDAGKHILNTLQSPDYLYPVNTHAGFLLQHSVGNKPRNSEIDVPIIYADYYFLEALRRLERIDLLE